MRGSDADSSLQHAKGGRVREGRGRLRDGAGTPPSLDSGVWQTQRSTSSARSTRWRPTTPSTRPQGGRPALRLQERRSVDRESGDKVLMKANSEERVKAVLEVFEAKLIKRGISLRSLDAGEPYPRQGVPDRVVLKTGIDSENAKKINKIIRDEAPKEHQESDPGRGTARVVQEPRRFAGHHGAPQGQDLDVALQFVNFRMTPPA